MVTTTEQLKKIETLFFVSLGQCSTAGEKVKVFQEIKALHVCLKRKICDHTAFNEISRYVEGKTNCMNLCGGVCENICHLDAVEFNQYIKRNNLSDEMIMSTVQLHS